MNYFIFGLAFLKMKDETELKFRPRLDTILFLVSGFQKVCIFLEKHALSNVLILNRH